MPPSRPLKNPKEVQMLEYLGDINIKKYEPYDEWFLLNLKSGDILITNDIEDMIEPFDSSEVDVLPYLKLLKKGVILNFEMTPECNSSVLETLNITSDKDIDLFLRVMLKAFNKRQALTHYRLSKRLQIARLEGKQVGTPTGSKYKIKKSFLAKEEIKKHSKSFDGNLSDIQLMNKLGLARNTFYKYKKELAKERDNE